MSVSRRDFLAGAAGAGIGFGLGALSHRFPLRSPEVGPDWRPGKESFVSSTCLLCPAHCGIRVRLVDGQPSRIDGNPLHPVSRGGLCPKGRAGIQLLYHPGRIVGPLERVGGKGSEEFRPVSWDAALDRIAGALQGGANPGGAAATGWLVGDCGGVMRDTISGFALACGTSRVAVDDYRDGSAGVLQMTQGIDAPPAFDLTSSDLVLSFGASLAESWWAPSMASRMRDAEPGRGPRWIQADVRLSRSAAAADRWVPVAPGSYGSLALGLAYLLLKEGTYDSETVSRRVAGWEDWRAPSGERRTGFRRLVLRHGRPDDVSARTGVPVTDLVALAKSLGSARRPVAVWDQAVAWRSGGLADALAIHALNVIIGSLNRPGGLLVQAPLPLPGGTKADGLLSRAPLASTSWSATTDGAQAVFLYKSNPVASQADGDQVREALSRVPLVVSFSPFFDESARCADLVLPDHTYLERWQDATAPAAVAFPVWSVVQPVTEPVHDTRATGDVILDLATRIGGKAGAWAKWPSMQAAVRGRGLALAGSSRGSAFVEPFRQEELRELESRGWWLPHGKTGSEYWNAITDSGGWFDPFYDYRDRSATTQRADGKVWIFPDEARQVLSGGAPDDESRFLPGIAAGGSGEEPGEYPLVLVPFRVMTLSSGTTPLMPWLLENLGVLSGSSWETWVEVNPETAAEHGIRSGQAVLVESGSGSFRAVARLYHGARPGVVNVPYGLHSSVEGWGLPRGANPLRAVGAGSDPATGLPDWYSGRVRLVPLQGGA